MPAQSTGPSRATRADGLSNPGRARLRQADAGAYRPWLLPFVDGEGARAARAARDRRPRHHRRPGHVAWSAGPHAGRPRPRCPRLQLPLPAPRPVVGRDHRPAHRDGRERASANQPDRGRRGVPPPRRNAPHRPGGCHRGPAFGIGHRAPGRRLRRRRTRDHPGRVRSRPSDRLRRRRLRPRWPVVRHHRLGLRPGPGLHLRLRDRVPADRAGGGRG